MRSKIEILVRGGKEGNNRFMLLNELVGVIFFKNEIKLLCLSDSTGK